MENVVKPIQMRVCLILMLVSFIISFIAYEVDVINAYSIINIFILKTSILVISTLLYGFSFYKMYRGRAWTRVVLTVLFIFSLLNGLSSILIFDYAKYPVFLAFTVDIIKIADIISLVLLWHPATSRWFREMKIAHLTASGAINTESAVNTTESTRSNISYNKILKILRTIRVLYILSVTLIMINIAAFYGLVVHLIANYPMSQNTATFTNVNIAAAASLLIIIFISLAFLIAEIIFDKKLQVYPSELIDRSYSDKTILFLSFLYVYFFFSLNNRILVSFFYMTPGTNNPGIGPIIYLLFSNIAIIYFVFRYLIKKIEDRKIWKYFWIFAPFIFLIVAPTDTLISQLGLIIFHEPFLCIRRMLKLTFCQ
jgi:hypothetical protein